MAARTSSSGSGVWRRSGSVRQSAETSSARRRSTSSVSSGRPRAASSSSSRAPIRQRFSTTERRRASVGCAVMTGVSSSRSRRRWRVVGAVAFADRVDGGGDRVLGRASPFAQGSDALVLLGEVDELEVRRERASDLGGAEAGELVDDALGLPAARVGGLTTQGDRRAPQPLDVAQQVRPLGLLEDAPEQRGEESDVAAQRRGHLGHGARVARGRRWSENRCGPDWGRTWKGFLGSVRASRLPAPRFGRHAPRPRLGSPPFCPGASFQHDREISSRMCPRNHLERDVGHSASAAVPVGSNTCSRQVAS